MESLVIKENGYEYIEIGTGPPLVLLHGLFGALSNWQPVLDAFVSNYRVIIPLMPIYSGDLNRVKPDVVEFSRYISGFLQFKDLKGIHLVGNSLGGHIGLCVTLAESTRVATLTLTGSSGLFETGMGSTYPRRGDKTYLRERVEFTFYNPQTATPELIDEVYDIVNNPVTALRVIKIARDAQRLNMRDELPNVVVPTCLIWGLNDNITPAFVAHEFHRRIPRAWLYFIDHCGHAPMMENSSRFNTLLATFLSQHLN